MNAPGRLQGTHSATVDQSPSFTPDSGSVIGACCSKISQELVKNAPPRPESALDFREILRGLCVGCLEVSEVDFRISDALFHCVNY